MRILFMGSPKFASIVLEKILDSEHEVVGLFCQNDKPFGRKKELKAPDTKEFLLKYMDEKRGEDIDCEIPIFQPTSMDEDSFGAIEMLRPDIVVVVAYGKILPKEMLELSRFINIHASILPKYRGASPIQEMIKNRDEVVGVTIMEMEEGLDSGDMLAFHIQKNSKKSELSLLSSDLAKSGAGLLLRLLDRIENGESYGRKIEPLKQIDCDSSYCKKIKKSDGVVRFENAREIFAKYLAYREWPNIFLESGLKIIEMDLVSEEKSKTPSKTGEPGKIVEIAKEYIEVACFVGSVKIFRLQAPNKNVVDAISYLNGKGMKLGSILG